MKYTISPIATAILLSSTVIACGGGGNDSNSTSSISQSEKASPTFITNAGKDISASISSEVTLRAQNSGISGTSYTWALVSQPDAANLDLGDLNTQRVSFSSDVAGNYVFELTVSKGGQSKTDSVTVSLANFAPSASITPPTNTFINELVTLDSENSSDPEGNLITSSWLLVSKPEGSQSILEDSLSSSPSFLPDLTGASTGRFYAYLG